ncbi:hypothetical protein AUP68_10477 [Ilyonectria robusta]
MSDRRAVACDPRPCNSRGNLLSQRVFRPIQANLLGLARSASTNTIPKDIFHGGARMPSASPNALTEMNDECTRVE